MQIIQQFGWVFYVADEMQLKERMAGKWMYFFSDMNYAASICENAVKEGVVEEAKHSDAQEGVACFYLNGDDIEAHKRVLQYFMDNNLIRKTKTGKLYNISFKFDQQTKEGKYGTEFHADIKLEKFVNLNTGEFLA